MSDRDERLHTERMGAIERRFDDQERFFRSGATLPRAVREEHLRALISAVERFESRILEASYTDLRRNEVEAGASEVDVVVAEAGLALRKLKAWMRPRRSLPPLLSWPGLGSSHMRPMGRNLIVSPWNYPFLLTLAPLVSCIAAGNVAILKPSEISSASSEVIAEMIRSTFSPNLVDVFLGGVDVSQALLGLPFDHIFFTGSPRVGRIVARAAAEHLTRATHELGGKSPTIVMPSADLDVAARRIALGKFFNTGQSCVAPDYVLAHRAVHGELLSRLRHAIEAFFGAEPKVSPDYGRIVNDGHFERLVALIDPDRVVCGGTWDAAERYIAPTLLSGADVDDPIMQEEIFGPLLPVLRVEDRDEAIEVMRFFPPPLALYLFTDDSEDERVFTRAVPFGGGCVNTTLLHFIDSSLPFGGVGNSGQGTSHGEHGFRTFSHQQGIMRAGTFIDPALRYPPYTPRKQAWIRRLMGRGVG